MAKHKYDKKLIVDVVGILDVVEGNRMVIMVDGIEYDFADISKSAIGTEIHFKSELIEE